MEDDFVHRCDIMYYSQVGLAVDDTKAIQDRALLNKLSLQVSVHVRMYVYA